MTTEMALPYSFTQFYITFGHITTTIVAGLISYGLINILSGISWIEKMSTAVCVAGAVALGYGLVRKIPRRNLIGWIVDKVWDSKWFLPYGRFQGRRCEVEIDNNRVVLVNPQHFGRSFINSSLSINSNNLLWKVFNGQNKIEDLISNTNVCVTYKQLIHEYVTNRAMLIATNVELISQPVVSWTTLANGWNDNTGLITLPRQICVVINRISEHLVLCNNLIHRINISRWELLELLEVINYYISINRPTVNDFYIFQRLIMIDIIAHKSIHASRVQHNQNMLNVWINRIGLPDYQKARNSYTEPYMMMNHLQNYGTIFGNMTKRVTWNVNYVWNNIRGQNIRQHRGHDVVFVSGLGQQHILYTLNNKRLVHYTILKRQEIAYTAIMYPNRVITLYSGNDRFESNLKRVDQIRVNLASESQQTMLKKLNKTGAELIFNEVDHNEHSFAHALSKLKMIELINNNVGHCVFEISSSLTGIKDTSGIHFNVATLSGHDITRVNNTLQRCDQLIRNNQFISLTIANVDQISLKELGVSKIISLNTQFDMTTNQLFRFMATSGVRNCETMMNFDTRILQLPYVYNNQNQQHWRRKRKYWIPVVHHHYASRYTVESWFPGKSQIFEHDVANIMDWIGTTTWKYNNNVTFMNDIVDNNGGYLHMNINVDTTMIDEVNTKARISLNYPEEEVLLRIKSSIINVLHDFTFTFLTNKEYQSTMTWTHKASSQRQLIVEEKQEHVLGMVTYEMRQDNSHSIEPTRIFKSDGRWQEISSKGDGRKEFRNELFRFAVIPDFERVRYVEKTNCDISNVNTDQLEYDIIEMDALIEGMYTKQQLLRLFNVPQAANNHQRNMALLSTISNNYDLYINVQDTLYMLESHRYNKLNNMILRIGDHPSSYQIMLPKDKPVQFKMIRSEEVAPLLDMKVLSLSDEECVPTLFKAIGISNPDNMSAVNTLQSIFTTVIDQYHHESIDDVQFSLREKLNTTSMKTKETSNQFVAFDPNLPMNEFQNIAQMSRDPDIGHLVEPPVDRDQRVLRSIEDTYESVHLNYGVNQDDIMEKYADSDSVYRRRLLLHYCNYRYKYGNQDHQSFRVIVFDNHIYLVVDSYYTGYQRLKVVVANPRGPNEILPRQLPYVIVRGREKNFISQSSSKILPAEAQRFEAMQQWIDNIFGDEENIQLVESNQQQIDDVKTVDESIEFNRTNIFEDFNPGSRINLNNLLSIEEMQLVVDRNLHNQLQPRFCSDSFSCATQDKSSFENESGEDDNGEAEQEARVEEKENEDKNESLMLLFLNSCEVIEYATQHQYHNQVGYCYYLLSPMTRRLVEHMLDDDTLSYEQHLILLWLYMGHARLWRMFARSMERSIYDIGCKARFNRKNWSRKYTTCVCYYE